VLDRLALRVSQARYEPLGVGATAGRQ
jgi:hypothetical protein